MIEALQKKIDLVASGKGNISDLLDELVLQAFYQNSSDLHMEPTESKDMKIRFRVDGILEEVATVKSTVVDELIFVIKVRSKLRTDVHFSPQDGRVFFQIEDLNNEDKVVKIDARISILPLSYGEKVVMRLLYKENRALTLVELGFLKDDLSRVVRGYTAPYGLILATGPTGSGKTTTLYSILSVINTPEINITTIEDPIEYSIAGVNHIQVNTKANLTFASGLRSILRQDPDVIMVGEVRDAETAKITINSALTGHLVLSTIHANNAISTIPRLLNLEIDPFLIATTVNVIISQRLGRRLCTNCKRGFQLKESPVEREMIKLRPDIAKHLKDSDVLYKAQGCEKCRNTGYKGRVGLYEVLEITARLRDTLSRTTNIEDILKAAREDGFKLLIEDGIEKLKMGVIDIFELIKVTSIRE
ncbi:MAG TPA: GspE/PulE family protein [Candidatus Dojkabacteria bacterium]|nr:GspE/PulE family protein [Candidatus Dojkabacteria bacterium]HQF36836.1 GspE/PulE family protein [Candidatus Dojkabacteria bacterium]